MQGYHVPVATVPTVHEFLLFQFTVCNFLTNFRLTVDGRICNEVREFYNGSILFT